MLESLTADTFSPHVGETFTVQADAGRLELTLTAANTWGQPFDGSRMPFTLVFHGPLEPVLRQQIRPVEHPSLGTLEIFLVPTGPDKGKMRYEAVFT